VLTVSHDYATPVTSSRARRMLTAQRPGSTHASFEQRTVIAESAGHLQKYHDLLDLARKLRWQAADRAEPTPCASGSAHRRQIDPTSGQGPALHRHRRETCPISMPTPGYRSCAGKLLTNANNTPSEGSQVRLRGYQGRGRGRVRGLDTVSGLEEEHSTRLRSSGAPTAPRPRRSAGPSCAWRSQSLVAAARRRDLSELVPGDGATFRLCVCRSQDGPAEQRVTTPRRIAGPTVDTATRRGTQRPCSFAGTRLEWRLRRGTVDRRVRGTRSPARRAEEPTDPAPTRYAQQVGPRSSRPPQRVSNIPFLMISAHLDANEPDRMRSLGASDCIPKPFGGTT